MSRSIRIAAVAGLVLVAACSDKEPPTGPSVPGAGAPAPAAVASRAEAVRAERVARRLALALADAQFRTELKVALDGSPFREQKLHFQRHLNAGQGRAAEQIARLTNAPAEEVTAEALAAVPLELYLPVAEHRAAWTGGPELLVATALADREAPVAFDLQGRRVVLDPARPPATPVLALVPVETDFDAVPALGRSAECGDCGAPGSGTTLTGLVMTYATFRESFEGWLKGAPEFEIHIMGPNSATDTTTARSYQCIGEAADAGYRWNMDNTTWYGAVRLFTNDQLAAFARDFPSRAFAVLALEDDDGPCVIKADRDLLSATIVAVGEAYHGYNGARDTKVLTPGGLKRVLTAGKSFLKLISALASLIKTNDEVIGFALADSITGRYHPTGNWNVIDKDRVSNGWLRLEVR